MHDRKKKYRKLNAEAYKTEKAERQYEFCMTGLENKKRKERVKYLHNREKSQKKRIGERKRGKR